MKNISHTIFFILLASGFISTSFLYAEKSTKKKNKVKQITYAETVPKPTITNIRYGEHERQVFDFWKAESQKPTPLVFVIHGGGWNANRKESVDKFAEVESLLKAGISVVAINYRYIRNAVADDVRPPVKAPLYDAARALQHVRSMAKELNIDKRKIAATGGSAGACSSLWLAFNDDMANPDSDDLVRRESTRLFCVAVRGAQTSLDPKQMREWIPNIKYGGHAFGFSSFDNFLESRETVLKHIKQFSPYHLLSSDDPPVYLHYQHPPTLGETSKNPTHSTSFGVGLLEGCRAQGVNCELVYEGASHVKYATMTEYLIAKLK